MKSKAINSVLVSRTTYTLLKKYPIETSNALTLFVLKLIAFKQQNRFLKLLSLKSGSLEFLNKNHQ